MTAWMDAVADATADLPRFYPQGEVPDIPPYPYGAFSASLGTGATYTLDAAHGVRRGRVTLQAFARTADAALSLTEQMVDRLIDRCLVVPGWDTTPLRVHLEPALVRQSDPENTGVIGVTTVLAFTATKETP